ncbi:FAD-dependent oxidoreductase [Novosphingobium sp. PC22D]|uniref:NAD(P)/FAD-dependent oxidoreductase n=1 Tax=Novosphingobium sp. PC22D TaxID=1962403 RepID=UPI000BF2434A|nr:NAD(P)/FAD-dependent oxidoreductase [Novosphingobium sp. PC22D]PEQ10406.1 FAD-dependent oxidoreductase [Novosphingobium sp. PC22D]
MDRVDAIVAGAGVVGLAVARALARRGREVLILEREEQFGTITSSRNSEVIHAGFYYPPGSLKERLCIEGRERLYAYCAAHGIAHRRCGKLVAAFAGDDVADLRALFDKGGAIGVELEWLDGARASALEPAIRCEAAIHSPSTGILDSHGLMLSLLGEAEDRGAVLARETAAHAVTLRDGRWAVEAGGIEVACDIFVNACGLGAQALAARIEPLDAALVPPLHYAKGSYFAYQGKVPFSRLVYPLPVPGSLGTHLALDLAGQARFGPDIEWVPAIDYHVDPARHAAFAQSARRIWPALDPEKLVPAYAGVRPKLVGPGEPLGDFVLQGEADHGLPGLMNLFGIESPGLTSSLAIAEEVCRRLGLAS